MKTDSEVKQENQKESYNEMEARKVAISLCIDLEGIFKLYSYRILDHQTFMEAVRHEIYEATGKLNSLLEHYGE